MDKLSYVESKLYDIYFGRGMSATIGGVEFNKFGFSFAGNVRNCPYDIVDINEHGGVIWVEFYKEGLPVVVVGIPKIDIVIDE